jgi:hypothetical protein
VRLLRSHSGERPDIAAHNPTLRFGRGKSTCFCSPFDDSGPRDRQEILEFWPEPGFLEFAMALQGAGSDPQYGATRRFLRLCCAQILGAHVLRRFRLA